ncbi:unnamed protein product [Brachionus calyciflorus]|uniref:Uncharacterized protein n=1 Tax=Brachionus calyciflorus TaxID=104777 RepID=A0A813WD38_9BILA|nr:unnamed protein product [Brachionus calyciflorus]
MKKKTILFVNVLTWANYWKIIIAMSYTKMFGFYEISPIQIGDYVSSQSTILLGSINEKSKLECFKTCSLYSDCLLIQFDINQNQSDQSNSYTYFYRKIQNKGIISDYTSQVVRDSKTISSFELWNNVFHVEAFTFKDHLNLIWLELYDNIITRIDENTFYNLSNLI